MLPYSIDPLHLSTPTCLCQHLWVTNSCPCQSMNTHMTLWDLNYMPQAHLNGIKYQLCIFIIILSMRIWWVLKYCWLIPPTLFRWHCKEFALLFIDVSGDQSKVWGVWLFAASPQGHGSQWKSYFSSQKSHLLHLPAVMAVGWHVLHRVSFLAPTSLDVPYYNSQGQMLQIEVRRSVTSLFMNLKIHLLVNSWIWMWNRVRWSFF